MRLFVPLILTLLLITPDALAQDQPEALQLVLPSGLSDNIIREGETFRFKLRAQGGTDRNYKFDARGAASGYEIDRLGNFSWFINYTTVAASERQKQVPFTFSVISAPVHLILYTSGVKEVSFGDTSNFTFLGNFVKLLYGFWGVFVRCFTTRQGVKSPR